MKRTLRACAMTLGAIAVVLLSGCVSSSKLIETYYVGTYDPESQLPPEVYRYRVNGSANAISSLKFASGWLPKELVDPLDSQIIFEDGAATGNLRVNSSANMATGLESFRPLYLFGPEGFRKAPQDHRLCIVISQNPEKVFRMAARLAGRPLKDDIAPSNAIAAKILERQRDAMRRILELRAAAAAAGGDE